jgi:mycothiol synthase
VPTLQPGYTLRAFDDQDAQAYEALFALAWSDTGTLDYTRRHALPGGFLVVEHDASRQLVASCVAFAPESPARHPHDGSLGWLVTDPTHTRRGLAAVVASITTNRLIEAGYKRPWLQTEDERVVALRLYLRLGWRPYLYADGMEARWRAVFDRIGERFTLQHCVR